MSILLTGGAGFIGSHMAAKLLQNDMGFIVVDNFSNSDSSQLKKLEIFFKKKIPIHNIDVKDQTKMRKLFDENQINTVIHFANLKSVNDSIKKSKNYYENNVIGSKYLFNVIKENNVKKFIFSSSATVYGEPNSLPISENHSLNALNPYAQNKIDIENLIINDQFFKDKCITKILRYFNPAGAFYNGLIGELPRGVPNNLIPYLLGVVNNIYPFLRVFGGDYSTPDGTAIRDYIHVMDLVDAHFVALQDSKVGVDIFNIGTGEGHSVLQIINFFEKVNNVKIPYKIIPRRKGDIECCYADNKKIISKLRWQPKYNLMQICKDAYQFSQKN